MNISSPSFLYYDGNRVIEYHEPVWEVKQGENIVLDVPGDYTLDSCQAADGDPPDPPPGPPPGPPPILPPGPMQKRTSGADPATKPPGAPSLAQQSVGDGSYVVGEHAKPPTSSTTDSVYRRFKDQILAANRSYGAATVRESGAPIGKLDTTTYSGDPMGAATPKGFVVRQFVYGLDYIDGEHSEREWAAIGIVNRMFTSGPRPARRK